MPQARLQAAGTKGASQVEILPAWEIKYTQAPNGQRDCFWQAKLKGVAAVCCQDGSYYALSRSNHKRITRVISASLSMKAIGVRMPFMTSQRKMVRRAYPISA